MGLSISRAIINIPWEYDDKQIPEQDSEQTKQQNPKLNNPNIMTNHDSTLNKSNEKSAKHHECSETVPQIHGQSLDNPYPQITVTGNDRNKLKDMSLINDSNKQECAALTSSQNEITQLLNCLLQESSTLSPESVDAADDEEILSDRIIWDLTCYKDDVFFQSLRNQKHVASHWTRNNPASKLLACDIQCKIDDISSTCCHQLKFSPLNQDSYEWLFSVQSKLVAKRRHLLISLVPVFCLPTGVTMNYDCILSIGSADRTIIEWKTKSRWRSQVPTETVFLVELKKIMGLVSTNTFFIQGQVTFVIVNSLMVNGHTDEYCMCTKSSICLQNNLMIPSYSSETIPDHHCDYHMQKRFFCFSWVYPSARNEHSPQMFTKHFTDEIGYRAVIICHVLSSGCWEILTFHVFSPSSPDRNKCYIHYRVTAENLVKTKQELFQISSPIYEPVCFRHHLPPLDLPEGFLLFRITLQLQYHNVNFICPSLLHSTRTLSENLSSMVGNSRLSDLNIIVRDTEKVHVIPAHMFILMTRAPALGETLQHQSNDSVPELIIPELDLCGVIHFLRYIYTGEFDSELEIADIKNLSKVSEIFSLPELKQACEYKLISSLDRSNALELFIHGELHAADDLKQSACQILCENKEIFKEACRYLSSDECKLDRSKKTDLLVEMLSSSASMYLPN